jgi:hypothetical protein
MHVSERPAEPFDAPACQARLDRLKQVVDERYRADLNIRLPVAFNVDGLALSEAFVTRLGTARGELVIATKRLERESLQAGIEQDAVAAAQGWRNEASDWPWREANAGTDLQLPDAATATQRLLDALSAGADSLRGRWDEEVSKHGRYSDAANAIAGAQQGVYRSLDRADDLLRRLRAPSATAATTQALLLTGEAGQGKTHLLVDCAQRMLDAGHPVAMVLGIEIGGANPWTAIAGALALEDRGGEQLVAALRGAARRAGRRALLIIDAINETEPISRWRSHMEPVRALVCEDDFVSIAVSCRTSYVGLIWPNGPGEYWTIVEHHGLRGREEDAAARYFSAYEIDEPRVPLLRPEFSTPLFLKVFCEGLRATGRRAPEPGAESHNAMFGRFVAAHTSQINERLELEPERGVVAMAIERFAQTLADRHKLSLPADEASALFDGLLPKRDRYPNTLFAQMLDVGLLRKDVKHGPDGAVEVVGFTYNRFADHVVAQAVLDRFLDPADPSGSFSTDEPLGQWLKQTTTGPMHALTTQLPERLSGVELLDVIAPEQDYRRTWFQRALIETLRSRDATSVTDRTRELLREAEHDGLGNDLVEALWELAPDPDHPLGGDLLHRTMLRHSMPTRDATWGPTLYEATEEYGVLERLVRWAARGPYVGYDERVIEAAATALMWALTSPNREARDYTTKALVQLLQHRLKVVERLVDRFADTDDPYLLERLAMLAQACVLRAGHHEPQAALAVFSTLRDRMSLHERRPNVLIRDAVRGVAEWCVRERLIGDDILAEVSPPYQSPRPRHPPRLDRLLQSYPKVPHDERHERDGYEVLWDALSGSFNDWQKYTLNPALRPLTRIPRTKRLPRRDEFQDRVRINRPAWSRFTQSLTEEQVREWGGALQSGDDVPTHGFRFMLDLTKEQRSLYHEAIQVRYGASLWHDAVVVPTEWAERWLLQHAVSLGWTPERFARFDRSRGGWHDRRPVRQRYADKYAAIALHELVARLTDNFHYCESYGEGNEYLGPWQLGLREMDPTLPPAPTWITEEDERDQGPTFALDERDAWWVQHRVDWSPSDPVDRLWAIQQTGLPALGSVLEVKDADGVPWIVVSGNFHWEEPASDIPNDEGLAGRDLGFDVETLLVAEADLDALMEGLTSRAIGPNPDPSTPYEAYFGELPWGVAARWERSSWDTYVGHGPDAPVPVLPFAQGFSREERGSDASLQYGVSARVPMLEVNEAGNLRWSGEQPTWIANEVVLQSRRTHGSFRGTHSALLARRDWLDGLLEAQSWAAVISVIGERHLYEPGHDHLVHPWLLFRALTPRRAGVWAPSKWQREEHDPASYENG